MTEFTKEYIEKQREQIKFISPLPWTACSCGKCGSISNKTDPIAKVTMGNWGDDYPDIRRIGGSIEGKFETFMNQITYGDIPKETATINAQYIANACNNYPEALDHIERLQARVQELEEALTKIANYESLRFRLSPYEYGVLEQIVGIAEHALRDGE